MARFSPTTDAPTLAAKAREVEELSAYSLASLADCVTPDSAESVGAELLKQVRDEVLSSFVDAAPLEDRDADEDRHEVDWDDTTHNIADSAPSIYTHTLWTQFVDLGAYQELDELISDGMLDLSSDREGNRIGEMPDSFRIPAVSLYTIAARLARELFEQLVEALQADVDEFESDDDDDDDDDPMLSTYLVLDAEGKEIARVRALTGFFAEGMAEEIEGYARVELAPEGE